MLAPLCDIVCGHDDVAAACAARDCPGGVSCAAATGAAAGGGVGARAWVGACVGAWVGAWLSGASALRQPAETEAACCCRHCSAACPPVGTPEQLAM